MSIQSITAVDLDRLYAQLTNVGSPGGRGPLAKVTIRQVHMVLGKALATPNARAWCNATSPAWPLPHPPRHARSPEMKVWTPEQLRTFLDFVADDSHGSMLRLAALTGLRRAELCGLRWQDVDLDERTTRRPAGDHNGRSRAVSRRCEVDTRSRRVIDLDPVTVNVLRAQRKHQLEERIAGGPGWVETGLVFTMPDGRGWHPDVITRAFARLVERSGLPRIRLHDLRHSHATHLLAAGTNARVTSERLGHASVAFTLDVYGHVLPGQQAEAAAAVAALVDR